MSTKHTSEYREHLYTVVKGLIPQGPVHACNEFLQEALKREIVPVFSRLGLYLFAPDCGSQVERLMQSGKPITPQDQHILLGHFPLSVRLSEAIYPLAAMLGRSELLKEIIGSDHLFLHMPPMMRFVPPGYAPAAVPPHQDISYNRHLSAFVTVWTPLVPITRECGGLVLYEGSGKDKSELVQEKQGAGWLPPVEMGAWQKRRPIDLVPGDVVIFSPYFVHASAPNLSNQIRLSMDLRVFGAHATSSKHRLDLNTMQTIAPPSARQEKAS